MPPRCPLARTPSPKRSTNNRLAPPRRHSHSQRLARHVLARAPRRSRDASRARSRYGPVTDRPGSGPVRRRIPRRQAASTSSRRHRRNSVPENQERLTFARCGITDPLSLSDYVSHGGYRGLERALKLAPMEIVDEVTNSGLARPRRRGLSHRHQVEDRSGRRRRSKIYRLQRRRGRQRNVCRPHDHGRRSIRARLKA